MKLRKYILPFAVLLLASNTTLSHAQETSKIKIDKNEKWWGGFSALGSQMPYVKPVEPLDFSKTNLGEQSAVFFISNLGRYIYSGEPVVWSFDGENFNFTATHKIKARKVGRNLRSAYVVALNDEMYHQALPHPPADALSTQPQYNTVGKYPHLQNHIDILGYANRVIENGFAPGVLIINDNWQKQYGSMEFRADRFWGAKSMVDSLHTLGFKVLLSVTPYVSPDSHVYRELKQLGYLVSNTNGKPMIAEWKNGYSALFDMGSFEAMAWYEAKLIELQTEYGVDGFAFEGGDLDDYSPEISNSQLAGWQALAGGFLYNQIRASWGGTPGDGGRGTVQKISSEEYSWDELKAILPKTIAVGLMGYPFVNVHTPANNLREITHNTPIDQELFVRATQVSAMMPMMQFSVEPWKVLDTEHLHYVRKATVLHQTLAPYILALIKDAAQTGEPIIRAMEYNYPRQGFADCTDQFMLGTRYIVTPIITKDHRRLVRLPRGTWVDDQGTTFRGPLVMEITAGLDRLPYFTRK